MWKSNCPIQICNYLVIICLLLLVFISVSCYYYYTRDWIQKGIRIVSFNIKWIVYKKLMSKVGQTTFLMNLSVQKISIQRKSR